MKNGIRGKYRYMIAINIKRLMAGTNRKINGKVTQPNPKPISTKILRFPEWLKHF